MCGGGKSGRKFVMKRAFGGNVDGEGKPEAGGAGKWR